MSFYIYHLPFTYFSRLEETLSCSGTTHRVNSIVVQPAFNGPKPFKQELKLHKTKKRSIKAPIQEFTHLHYWKKT